MEFTSALFGASLIQSKHKTVKKHNLVNSCCCSKPAEKPTNSCTCSKCACESCKC
ncbi:metallothionein family 11-domain-containing protein [Yarrowia lipolytica]|uniref:YALI0C20066p n=2 Tax=Yarrowia lipolytica TaxID=4952 RepID=B5FVD2_YARLI|nr:YALI0C20066p [Yarrowia lipolytica CLIB122]KAB8281428.1 metallothionein family 11-domain-containing protein [Yarrowia lipolytica]KAE8173047.1 metallothionein family 11-domain-containing protein [Yarrowia lipolytica]RDW24176.1 metallothionein family 11-domain-containing protein [Yarrowia lipolytica]RDW30979.1 metallothionein family 11-domain-containing protein [Yarrowia lipolytica]RDW37818.1 metallothionein family 11-domain-containing protein [Yarrowia lipolytica]|eukprot:XP_002143039.1 YALI0C20066p [Yarrowia lipolytica CLIB122]